MVRPEDQESPTERQSLISQQSNKLWLTCHSLASDLGGGVIKLIFKTLWLLRLLPEVLGDVRVI